MCRGRGMLALRDHVTCHVPSAAVPVGTLPWCMAPTTPKGHACSPEPPSPTLGILGKSSPHVLCLCTLPGGCQWHKTGHTAVPPCHVPRAWAHTAPLTLHPCGTPGCGGAGCVPQMVSCSVLGKGGSGHPGRRERWPLLVTLHFLFISTKCGHEGSARVQQAQPVCGCSP